MSTDEVAIPAGMAYDDVLRRAIEIVTGDVRISGLKVLGSLLASIPLLGGLLQLALDGVAIQIADAELTAYSPDNSFGKRFVFVLIASILSGVAVGIGLVLLVLPGIYLALRLALVAPAVWVGDQGPIEALSESWSRTDGHLWTVLVVEAVIFFGTMLVLVPAFVLTVGASEAALQEFAQSPTIVVAPGFVLATAFVAATVGAVGTVSGVVMYRSFRPPVSVEDEPDFQTD
jgi:hypothetical protein